MDNLLKDHSRPAPVPELPSSIFFLNDVKRFFCWNRIPERRIGSVSEPEAFVFISYSHVDARFADEFCSRLKNAGVRYFIDRSSIEWGGHIPDHVHAALELASHLVVLISQRTQEPDWINPTYREESFPRWQLAADKY
jgi:hypothetical protein